MEPQISAEQGLSLFIAASALASCGVDSGLDPIEARAARAVAAAEFQRGQDHYRAAREALAPLLDRRAPDPEDVLRAAIIDLAMNEPLEARARLESITEVLGERAEHAYCMGLTHSAFGEFEAAISHFQLAHELRPACYPTRLMLASTLKQADREDEAIPHYEALREVGVDEAGSWHLSVIYQLGHTLMFQPETEERGIELMKEFEALVARGLAVPAPSDIAQGELARLHLPEPERTVISAPPSPPSITYRAAVQINGVEAIAVAQLEERWFEYLEGVVVTSSGVGPQHTLAWGPSGLWCVAPEGAPEPTRLLDGPVDHVVVCSFDRDPRISQAGDMSRSFVFDSRPTNVVVARESTLSVLEYRDGELRGTRMPDLELPGPIADIAVVDFDHEGDLDIVCVGPFGVRLFRNDGFGIPQGGDPGAFAEATTEGHLPLHRGFAWVVTEDYDTDGDVDLLLGGPGGGYLASSLRGGRFEDASEQLGGAGVDTTAPLVADLNGDALPDLWQPGAPPTIWWQRPSGRFERSVAGGDAPGPASAADVDLDGAIDVLAQGGGRLALGLPEEADWRMPEVVASVLADPDDDLAAEVMALTEEGVVVGDATGVGSAIRLALVGVKDNRRGVGAVVEVLAGPIYRRLYWRGEPMTIGLGGRTEADVIRIRWPSGVVQHETRMKAGTSRTIMQLEGLAGSCPFLYTWNGKEFEFVSDVLGITPLGLPIAPGVLVPPDHDEYVLVRGEQLVPEGGVYTLHLTEELREVTYLDRVRLDVVDHPVGTDIWPNERFCFPPFPEPRVHTTRGLAAPRSAIDGDGRDWAGELGEIDFDFAAPFEPYHGQLLGLAPPHTLELEFDPSLVADAERLRLVMTGWFYWTDASVNMAAARTPGVDFVPPVLQVPDGEGGWRDAGPPIGFPAGKTKTMVVDVSELLDSGDPRLRIFSTLRLYWDSIRLATDGDDAPVRTTAIEPSSAELWERGYTEPIVIDEEHGLEWFEWERTAEHPRWNQHPGRYTKYGDVLPLLGEIDDRFVIMGAGDALTLRFDATALPELEDGWTRDYLVFFDGWAKDRDPNTNEALMVEPLPFHGMSGYPYGEDEAFPDDEEHRAWRREWNTRPAKQWIEALAPLARRGYVGPAAGSP